MTIPGAVGQRPYPSESSTDGGWVVVPAVAATSRYPAYAWEPVAAALAPHLAVDDAEPFLPQAVAVTVVDVTGTLSPTVMGLVVDLAEGAEVVVEYALWWEYEIGHLYGLEHVWVHGRRTAAGWAVVAVEGSAHGHRHALDGVRLHNGRPVIYLEPGKHGTAVDPESFAAPRDVLEWLCSTGAGRGGVCVTAQFEGYLHATPRRSRQARRFLSNYAFTPTWSFSRVVDTRDLPAVPWDELRRNVPAIVADIVSDVPSTPLARAGCV